MTDLTERFGLGRVAGVNRFSTWGRVAGVALLVLVLAGCTAAVRPTVATRELIFDIRAEDFVARGAEVVGIGFPVPQITAESLGNGMTVVVWWRPDFAESWWSLPYSFQSANDTHAVSMSYTVGGGLVTFRIESPDVVAVQIWRDLAVGKLRVVLTGHPDDVHG